jgi:hypothetical protein
MLTQRVVTTMADAWRDARDRRTRGPLRSLVAVALVLTICLFGCSAPDVDSDDRSEQRTALDRLLHAEHVDERMLADIALDHRNDDIAVQAALRIEDPALLETLAVGSAWFGVRYVAGTQLKSPGHLALLLRQEPDKAMPFVASQSDRGLLLTVNQISERGFNAWSVAYDANDRSVLLDDFGARARQEWRNCGVVAALKLSLDDPTVRKRLGDVTLTVLGSPTSKTYRLFNRYTGDIRSAGEVLGETVTVRIDADPSMTRPASPLVERTFTTDFPSSKSAEETAEFRAADMSATAVLAALLRRDEFAAEDIRVIATLSEVSELRASAVSLIDDQGLLATIAQQDPAPNVRFAAIEKLQVQELLYQIAMNLDEKLRIRYRASTRVTDPLLSKKLMANSTNDFIRNYQRAQHP